MKDTGQFVRFLLAGGLAAVANFGSRFVFSHFVSFVPAVVLAFLVGLVTGFAIMRAFVFSGRAEAPAKQAGYYLLVNLVGLAVTVVVSVVVAKGVSFLLPDPDKTEALGHLAGVAAPALLSFYAHKKLTFR